MARDHDNDPKESTNDTTNMAIAITAPAPMTPACLYNDITSPFDKPCDLSQKADQECWIITSKAASNQVCFNVSVATAKTFMELLKDKSKYYCWSLLMSDPLNGNGIYNATSNQLKIS
jgi:hypothetical protein